MARVFVTGGSGYIGRAVLGHLADRGDTVSALARSDAAAAVVRERGATPVHGDLTDLALLKQAAARADAVVHLGAAGQDTAAVDLAAATALQAGAGSDPYVHTGGLWVYGTTDGVADEDAPLAPPALTAWRVDNERRVLDSAATGAHPVVVMPGIVYGHARGLVQSTLVDAAREHDAVQYPGDGANHWALVHVDDLADLYVRALGAPAGGRYLAVSENIAVADIARALGRAPGNPGRVESVPVAAFADRFGLLAEALLLDQRLTSGRARADLGWSPSHTDAVAELARG